MAKMKGQLLTKVAFLVCTALLMLRASGGLQAVALTGDASITASQDVVFVGHLGGRIHGVEVQGNYAYIGEGSTMVILDISDLALPTAVGRTHPLPVWIWDLQTVGSYAYVAGDSGLWIGDISTPTNPIQIGFYDTPAPASGVAVIENYAYVAHWDGLRIVDVSDPANPVEAGSYDVSGHVHDVTVVGEYAYVAAGGGGLRILDVSSPSTPTEVGSYTTPGHAYEVVVREGYAYVADEFEGLRVIDVSDPVNPTEVGFHDTRGGTQGLAVTGDYAYLASTNDGLRVIDISDPSSPAETGSYNPSSMEWAQTVAVVGGHAYVTDPGVRSDSEGGLWVVNVTNPAEPSGDGFYGALRRARSIAITEDYVYATVRGGSLWVMDVTNPANSAVSFDRFFPGTEQRRMSVAGGYIYAVPGLGGLGIADITDPTSPTLVSRCSVPGSSSDVSVVGDLAYVAGGVMEYPGISSFSEILAPPPPVDACLWMVDVADPAHPEVRGSHCVASGDYAKGVAVAGNHAYVVGSSLRVIDIADPANPVQVGSLVGLWDDVVTLGSYAYVVYAYSGLCIVDISDPTNPTEVGCHDIPGSAIVVSPTGGYLYVIDYSTGLHVVDVSDPVNPVEVDSYDIGSPNDLATGGNYVGIASADDGLFVLHHATEALPHITGRVLDAKGDPVGGGLVATNTGHTATTDDDGWYAFTGVLPGTYSLTPRIHGYFWSPANRTVTIPPNATGQDFVGRNILKEGALRPSQALDYGDTLTYTVGVVYPDARTVVLYDKVPTHTTYISDSLSTATGVVYDPIANALSGTLSLTATVPETVSFSVRVEVTGTVDLAPIIVNQACVHPVGAELGDCAWSNQIINFSYVWPVYLPLLSRSAAFDDSWSHHWALGVKSFAAEEKR